MLGLLAIGDATDNLFVPFPAFVMSIIAILVGLVGFVWVDKKSYALSLTLYSLAAITVATLVVLTGGAHSPFIALWLLIVVFSFLYGWPLALASLAAGNIYILYELVLTARTIGGPELLQMFMIAEAPVVISYIIWHKSGNVRSDSKSAPAQASLQDFGQSDIVIQSIADGVVVIDEKGIIRLINPAAQKLMGWSSSDALQLDYRSIIKLQSEDGDDLPEETSPIKQVMINNKPVVNNDLSLVTRSGKRARVSMVVSPMTKGPNSTAGSNMGVIAVFRDIAQEKDQERSRNEFISTASHEMRTPVAAIEGYLGLALNPATAQLDEKAREFITKAQESTKHLGRLFQDLLTVSKAEDSRLIPRPKPIDIIKFAKEVTEGLMPKAKEKGLEVNFMSGQAGAEGKVLPVFYTYFDPDNLREILNNLIDNAIKYTNKGGVKVDITGSEDKIIITITDEGIGVPPEDVQHLFEKFYRADNSETRQQGGTGLGLYICRRLVEANNGVITVESIFGKGTTVKVQMPRISHEKAEQVLSNELASKASGPIDNPPGPQQNTVQQ